MFRITARRRTGQGRRTRGQGLVEFALVLPIILLLTMTALDFGRIYLGYINVQNMARVAANFAANNAAAIAKGDAVTITKYRNQIDLDAAATNCKLPGPAPLPTFSDADLNGQSTEPGDNATVGLTCSFNVITPFISSILGNSINVSTSVVFPIKAGITGTSSTGGGGCTSRPTAAINAAPSTTGSMPSFNVTFTDASGGCPATWWHWDFGDGQTLDGATPAEQDPPTHSYTHVGTYTVTLTVTNPYGSTTTGVAPGGPSVTITVLDLVTPPPLCTVPRFSDPPGVNLGAVPGMWGSDAAGFSTTPVLIDENPSNGTTKVKAQSLVGGSLVPCDSPITVTSN